MTTYCNAKGKLDERTTMCSRFGVKNEKK